MSGTKEGGRKARDKNIANDPDFYKRIGSIGGRNGNTGGFADRELASRAGRIGGLKSRRRGPSKKAVVHQGPTHIPITNEGGLWDEPVKVNSNNSSSTTSKANGSGQPTKSNTPDGTASRTRLTAKTFLSRLRGKL